MNIPQNEVPKSKRSVQSYTVHICTACKVLQNITRVAIRVRAVQINVCSVQDGKEEEKPKTAAILERKCQRAHITISK